MQGWNIIEDYDLAGHSTNITLYLDDAKECALRRVDNADAPHPRVMPRLGEVLLSCDGLVYAGIPDGYLAYRRCAVKTDSLLDCEIPHDLTGWNGVALCDRFDAQLWQRITE